ncbi:hypothetical protein KRX51_06185 [Corynebacterium sp. TAE3-ERU12]|uniref:hypothetical protein n=1 Tax=Corynebacterium sp. TAE3-ERU12 TaxID=2849491 RepID=UPI001C442535|nr:hypothetical protein [Corynebacterium sp. TAE3-ERU12]MBV7295508.1 hypothetical protein [Corynebacterium sp. TAE3-ERU12]
MGRHSTGESNYRISRGLLFLIVALIVVAALVVSWVVLNRVTDERRAVNADCTKGDISIRVSADPAVANQAQQLVADYGESNPVAHDYCVRPQLMVSGSYQVVDAIRAAGEGDDNAVAALPAVWIPAVDSAVDAAEDLDVVSVSDIDARLSPEPVGLAVPADQRDQYRAQTWDELSALNIAAPGGDDAVVSSLVAAHIDDGEAQQLRDAAIARAEQSGDLTADTIAGQMANGDKTYQALAATQSMTMNVGPGVGFISPEGSAAIAAPVVAFGSGGPIDEPTARAAKSFTDFAAQRLAADDTTISPIGPTGAQALAVMPDLARLQTDPYAGNQDPAQAAGDAPAGSTVLLVDTSTEVDIDALRPQLVPVIEEAGTGAGRRVALWNFSSPQSPGVQSPVRANTYLSGATPQADVDQLNQLRSVGEPWMWPSLREAFGHAQDGWLPETTNRVVLVSSGLDLSGEDPNAAVDRLREMIGEDRPVRVDIVLIGDDRTNGGLQSAAEATGGVVIDGRQDLPAALRQAFGLG